MLSLVGLLTVIVANPGVLSEAVLHTLGPSIVVRAEFVLASTRLCRQSCGAKASLIHVWARPSGRLRSAKVIFEGVNNAV